MEYHMRVHIFGNSPSPSIAVYKLKRTAVAGEEEYGSNIRLFIERHFYVDVGLKSFSSTAEVIDVQCRAQQMLARSNLHLHKIASNSPIIMTAFLSEDLATTMQGLDLSVNSPTIQQSLGLCWDLSTDTFVFQVSISDKPYTKRKVLSTINSLYDPLGFIVLVSIEGSILRNISGDADNWDVVLPKEKQEPWQKWIDSLKHLQGLQIPRMYTSTSLSTAHKKEIIVFCDVSVKAVGTVAYLKITNADGQ